MENKNRLGLTLGIFFAFLHFVWALCVALGIAQMYLDWIFPMHFIGNIFSIMDFNIGNAILLIVIAFIGGYICGWLVAWVYEWFQDKKTKKRK